MGHQPDHSLSLPPHVLIFPLPIQGHVNSMLKLSELLSLSGLHVTMLVSDFSHRRLLRHSTAQTRLSQYSGFQFKTISDGLPDDHPRAGERVMEIMPAVKAVTGPLFKEMMVETGWFGEDGRRRPVTCLIADGVLSFAGDFALEMGIPLIYFRTVSACSFWACFRMVELIENGEIPLKGNGMDLPVKSVPGMEGFLRRRDLPAFCRVDEITDSKLQIIKTETRQTTRAQAVLKNTFDDLEGPINAQIQTHCPNLFSIGPLPALLKSRLAEKTTSSLTTTSSGSFWEEDRTCLTWLDSQPSKSVIYVSFGSITVVTRDQLIEFWYGLVNSGQRFLWVMRPDSVAGDNQIPTELLEGTKERGYMVEWAPQEEVLDHHAIGGFLTHSGWNSTLESIVAGVPMICWPFFADQMINSRFVSEVWKLGLDMKDTCERMMIEKMIRDLMVIRKDEFQQRSDCMAKLAKRAVSQGGSSYCNLDRLIEYIRSMIV